MTVFEDIVTFPADHPALPGHFPGNPIVPGALLLAAATTLIGQAAGRRVTGLRNAKFLASLKPETPCRFRLNLRDGGMIDLACSAGETSVLTVAFETRPIGEPA